MRSMDGGGKSVEAITIRSHRGTCWSHRTLRRENAKYP